MKHLMESQMAKLASMLTIGFGVLIGGAAAQAQQTPLKMTLFGQPSVNSSSSKASSGSSTFRRLT